MNIYGEKILLRAMELEDMDLFRETTNDPFTEVLLGGWSFPVAKIEQMRWYENAINDKSNLRFTIEVIENQQVIGMLNLVDIDWKNRSAFHGIRLFKDAPKRHGYGKDAVMALMKYAFEELQLVRLDGSWIEYNIPSLEMYKQCGWIVNGKKRKAKFTRGRYYDILLGEVLAEDYFTTKMNMNWIPYDERNRQ